MGGTDALAESYLRLRQAIGWLGLTLPFLLLSGALLIFHEAPQASISDYYYTGMRDVFVGAHIAFGVFLASYRVVMAGDRSFDADRWPGHLASFFVIVLALFPTNEPRTEPDWIAYVHYTCAFGWMLTLAYFVNCLFPRSVGGGKPTEQKRRRNQVYRWCGRIMLVMIGLLVAYFFLPDSAKDAIARLLPVFSLETIAVLAFGCAWLVKGEFILKDG